MSTAPFRLNPALDRRAIRAAYERDGRVRVQGLLADEGALALRNWLRRREEWRQILNSGDKVFELDRATRDGLSDGQRRTLDEAVMAGVRTGFQYRYESIRVPDGRAARLAAGDPLTRFAAWLSEGEALDFLRAATGHDDALFADAQATAYAPGDLLTAHDDAVPGKDRRAAYVLGLNPEWRAEWGGLLLFHDGADRVAGMVPGFNTLDLLSVPQPHSVSMVTPATPSRRYAVTGWLRAQRQPD